MTKHSIAYKGGKKWKEITVNYNGKKKLPNILPFILLNSKTFFKLWF